MSFAQWINDRRWAANVRRARAFQRSLSFSERQVFQAALRHPASQPGTVIGYPDAFWYVEIDDLLRAMEAVYKYRTARVAGFGDLYHRSAVDE